MKKILGLGVTFTLIILVIGFSGCADEPEVPTDPPFEEDIPDNGIPEDETIIDPGEDTIPITGDAQTLSQEALALFNERRFEEALVTYEMAIEADPNYPTAWTGKGMVFSQIMEFDDAMHSFERALELDSGYSDAWVGKGFTVHIQNIVEGSEDFEGALEYFETAIDLDQNNPSAWAGKGMVLEALGRSQEAQEAFERAEELGYQFELG